MNLIEKKIALGILNDWRGKFAEYDEYRDECYKEGFSPEHCIHGTYLWTDYDPICGPCEDGYGYFDYLEYLEISRNRAKELVAEFHKDLANAQKVRELARNAGAYAEIGEATEIVVKKMIENAWEPIEKYLPKK